MYKEFTKIKDELRKLKDPKNNCSTYELCQPMIIRKVFKATNEDNIFGLELDYSRIFSLDEKDQGLNIRDPILDQIRFIGLE